MKKITLLLLLLVSTVFYSQTRGITYQAIIYNPNGEVIPGYNNTSSPLANKNICLQFSIIDAASQTEYQETITYLTDEFGMVNTIIGSGNQTGGYAASFSDIFWSQAQKSLKVTLDVKGLCTNFVEISNQNIESVPFSFSATNAENVTGVVPIENGGTNAITVLGAKTNLGLENVDNTRDLDKPISNDSQAALNLKENSVNKSTDVTLSDNTNTKFPTVLAVKTYVDARQSIPGPQGLTGAQGPQGVAGTNGTNGASGPQGAIGLQGIQGIQGDIGVAGPQGVAGTNGTNGATGLQGPAGIDGTNGTNGIDGAVGLQGVAGTNGTNGATGLQGDIGVAGPQGVAGTNGATGLQGPAGIAGNDGINGLDGAVGPQGQQGPAGINGIDGSNATVTVGAISSSSNSNGASVNNAGELNLAPADENNVGIVTTGNQIFGGNKTFTGRITGKTAFLNGGDGTFGNAFLVSNNDSGFLASYNSLGTIRTGYLGFSSGNSVVLKAEETNSLILGAGNQNTLTLGADQKATFAGGAVINGQTDINGSLFATNGTFSQRITGKTAFLNGGDGTFGNAFLVSNNDSGFLASYNSLGTIRTGYLGFSSGNSVILKAEETNSLILGAGNQNTLTLGANQNAAFAGNVTATSFIKSGGTSSQFLKADGTVDSTTYLTTAGTATNVSGVVDVVNGGTGSSTQNFVDLTTNQNISGTKNFSSNATFNGQTIGKGNASGGENLAVGAGAMNGVSTGVRNTALGGGSMLQYVGTGFDNNTSVGYNNMIGLTTGSANTSVGGETMFAVGSASNNTAIGNHTLMNASTNYNTALGANAGNTVSTGSQNTLLGFGADVLTGSLYNATALGYGSNVATNNTIQLGNTSVSNVNTSGFYSGSGFKTPTGTPSQFLKADGTVDSTTYLTTAGTATNVSGVVAIANGGTGATTAVDALTNLGGAPIASPTLTGVPLAPTPINTTNTTQIATTAFIQDLLLNSPSAPSSSALSGAIWTSATTGTLNGIGFTVGGYTMTNNPPNLLNQNYSSSDYSSSPLSASQQTSYFMSGSSWTVTFNSPISNLKLYVYWRGPGGMGGSSFYQFDQSFSIATGSTGMTSSGNNLNVTGWGKGILEFSGPITSLTLSADGTSCCSGHTITFASGGGGNASASGTGEVVRIDSPNFTGTPTAPTAAAGTNTTQLATTAFVTAALATSTSNFVDLTTDQNISGYKGFTNNLHVQGIGIGKGDGFQSTVFGYNASAGDDSTAIGFFALDGNSGTTNTVIGTNALRNSSSTSYITAVGVNAGANSNTGNYNTFIGYAASVPNASVISNATAIGAGAIVTTDNTIQLGNSAITNVKTNGTITAGNLTYPNTDGTANQVLTTNGSGIASWTNPTSISIGSIGGSSNANGASIANGELNLTPADATNGGVVTTGNQAFTGDKTFNNAVAIGGTSSTTSAIVEVTSTTQGFLPPRMTSAQRDAIVSPTKGLIIMCTDCGAGELEVYNGSWKNISGTDPSATITLPTIGSSYEGGLVGYILTPSDPGYEAGKIKGLIVTPADIVAATGIRYDAGTAIAGINNSGTTIGTGLANTTASYNTYGSVSRSVPKIAMDYSVVENGITYDDWYVPSRDELLKIHANKASLGSFPSPRGYWTSTYWTNSQAITIVIFSDTRGYYGGDGTDDGRDRLRLVRSFTIAPVTTISIANGGTGSSTQNFVDLTEGQTISGNKTFISDLNVNGITIGNGAGNDNSNTAIGYGTLRGNTGFNNTSIGAESQFAAAGMSGNENTSVGSASLSYNQSGNSNTALGYMSLFYNENSNNTAIGKRALFANQSGSNNTAIGNNALYYNNNGSGSNNTAIGNGSDVYNINNPTAAIGNATAIGNGAIVDASNKVQVGNLYVTAVQLGTGTNVTLETGAIKLTGGSPAIGKVLTSDANGLASWETPSGGGGSAVREVSDECGVALMASFIDGATQFTLTQTPSNNSKVKMFINGVRISNTAYSLSGNIVTYVPANNGLLALLATDRLQFDYFY